MQHTSLRSHHAVVHACGTASTKHSVCLHGGLVGGAAVRTCLASLVLATHRALVAWLRPAQRAHGAHAPPAFIRCTEARGTCATAEVKGCVQAGCREVSLCCEARPVWAAPSYGWSPCIPAHLLQAWNCSTGDPPCGQGEGVVQSPAQRGSSVMAEMQVESD